MLFIGVDATVCGGIPALGLNVWEILVILVILLIIFGAGKLPSVMGDLAKGIRAFKQGLKDEDAGGPERPAPPSRPDTPPGGG